MQSCNRISRFCSVDFEMNVAQRVVGISPQEMFTVAKLRAVCLVHFNVVRKNSERRPCARRSIALSAVG